MTIFLVIEILIQGRLYMFDVVIVEQYSAGQTTPLVSVGLHVMDGFEIALSYHEKNRR